MAKITVIGSVNMDAVAKVETFPRPGQTVSGKSIAFYPGGKGANQCIAARRFGGDVEMCGMLGQDGNGEVLRKLFLDEKIETRYLFSCPIPTGMALILIEKSGENQITVIPSANHVFGMKELYKIEHLLKETKLLVLQLELSIGVTEEMIRLAHRYGTKVLLNPAPAAPLSPEVLGMVDYFIPNETELSFYTGMPVGTDLEVEAAARKLLALGVKTVIATLGHRGAMIVSEEQCTIVPGFPVNAVDTVAAGDSFCGAFAVAVTEGKPLVEAVRLANAMGALTVRVEGAIPSLHTREQVETFLAYQSSMERLFLKIENNK